MRDRAVAILCLVLCVGCASNPKILRIFFDGVPDPEVQAAEAAPAEETGEAAPAASPAGPKLWQHGPYASGKCSLCHQGGASQGLRLPQGKLCQKCHTGQGFAGSIVHGPVASGQCGGCHEPHRSSLPHLLRSEGPDLCLRCHSPESFPHIVQHQEDTGGECLECHRPHASDEPYLLR